MEQLLELCKSAYWELCKPACWVVDTEELPVEEARRWAEDWLVCTRSAWEEEEACRLAL